MAANLCSDDILSCLMVAQPEDSVVFRLNIKQLLTDFNTGVVIYRVRQALYRQSVLQHRR